MLSWPDVKLSIRLLIKSPGLTVVSTIGITVGIAITAGMFGFFHAILAPTLPLDEGDRIIALENWDIAKNNENRQSLHDFVTWRDQMTSVVEISAFRTITGTMQAGDRLPETVRVAAMSPSGFRVARVPALLGRFLTSDDEREAAPPVVVIGYNVWQSRFGQDRAVIGQQISSAATRTTVVGVMPEGFAFPVNHQYWITLRANPSAIARGAGPVLFVFGRLAPAATMESAQVELSVIGQRAAAEFPQTNARLKPQVLGYTKPINDVQDMGIRTWVMMQLTVSLVLIVVALNVAILLYARTATRRGEIAVRTALGASRGRIVTQLFIEALVLALVPALLGLALGQYAIEIGTGMLAQEWAVPRRSGWTTAFSRPRWSTCSCSSWSLPRLPASCRRFTRRDDEAARTFVSSAAARAYDWAGCGARSSSCRWRLRWPSCLRPSRWVSRKCVAALRGPNYPVEEFVAVGVTTDIGSNPFGNRLLELKRRLQAEPEVAGVTFAASLPQRNSTGRIEVEGFPVAGVPATTAFNSVTTFGIDTDYLDVYGLRVISGRPFNALDASASNSPVIVDRSFTQRFLNGESAVGRRIRYAASAPNGQPRPGTRSLALPRICGGTRSTPMSSARRCSIQSHPGNWRVRA